MSDFEFRYERLKVYQMALLVAHDVQHTDFPTGLGAVRQQAIRSSASICLNIAEAQAFSGKKRAQHYRIALGSTEETAAALDVAFVANRSVQKDRLGQVAKMLQALLRSCSG